MLVVLMSRVGIGGELFPEEVVLWLLQVNTFSLWFNQSSYGELDEFFG